MLRNVGLLLCMRSWCTQLDLVIGEGLGRWKAKGQSCPSCRDSLVPKVGTEKSGKSLETEVESLGLAERKSGRQHGSGGQARVLYKGPVQLEAQSKVR